MTTTKISIVPHLCQVKEESFWECYKNEYKEIYAKALLQFACSEFERSRIMSNFEGFVDYISDYDKLSSKGYTKDFEFILNFLSDSIRIIMCFENIMKCKLIRSGYSIHKIESKTIYDSLNLTKPVKIDKLLELNNSNLSDVNKPISGMSKMTHSISHLLNGDNDYLEIFKFPENFITFLENLRKIRNKLHYCYKVDITIDEQWINTLREMKNFVSDIKNRELIN